MTSHDGAARAAAYYAEHFGDFRRTLKAASDTWSGNGDLLCRWAQEWTIEGYLARDVDVLVSWVSDDFTHRDPINLGRVVRGPGEFRQMLQDTFVAFPDSAFEAAGAPLLGFDGRTVVLPWRAYGHFTGPLAWGRPGSRRDFAPTGRRFDMTGCDIYSFTGDKVSAMESFYDPIEVAEQLGLIPARSGIAMRIAPWAQGLSALAQRTVHRVAPTNGPRP